MEIVSHHNCILRIREWRRHQSWLLVVGRGFHESERFINFFTNKDKNWIAIHFFHVDRDDSSEPFSCEFNLQLKALPHLAANSIVPFGKFAFIYLSLCLTLATRHTQLRKAQLKTA